MSNLIEKEIQESQKFNLIEDKETGLIELTRLNVALVEAMIHNDSDYYRAFDKNAEPDEKRKFKGSTAYWMSEIKKAIEERDDSEYKKAIEGAVSAVDRDNSTHLSSDGVGLTQISARLTRIGRDGFLDLLRNPGDEYKLLYLIAEKTEVNDQKHFGRVNTSFASKFCHYACMIIFEGMEEQDSYSIYDNIVRKALPKYIKAFGLKDRTLKELTDYRTYQRTIDEIIDKAEIKYGGRISRNGFDHLLWYYHKARN